MTTSAHDLRRQAVELHRQSRQALRAHLQCRNPPLLELDAAGILVCPSADASEPNRVSQLGLEPDTGRLCAHVCMEGEVEIWSESDLADRMPILELLALLEAVEQLATTDASQTEEAGCTTHRIPACGGDRRHNLNAIADAIQTLTPSGGTVPVTLAATQARQLWGWGEQLRIIATTMPVNSRR